MIYEKQKINNKNSTPSDASTSGGVGGEKGKYIYNTYTKEVGGGGGGDSHDQKKTIFFLFFFLIYIKNKRNDESLPTSVGMGFPCIRDLSSVLMSTFFSPLPLYRAACSSVRTDDWAGTGWD